MGQATLDLPDPMQSPAAPTTAGTDDLLAQLAGDEIERLLAETDTERSAAQPADGKLLSVEPIAPISASPAMPPPVTDHTTGAGTTGAAKENLTSQLDALFESLSSVSPPAPASTAADSAALAVAEPAHQATEAADSTPLAMPATPDPAAAAATAETATSTAELNALGEPIPEAEAAAIATEAAALAQKIQVADAAEPEAELGEDLRPSLLVRWLEMINSPWASCPDAVMQMVGKIAIATLLNAIAVLAYTLVVRHR